MNVEELNRKFRIAFMQRDCQHVLEYGRSLISADFQTKVVLADMVMIAVRDLPRANKKEFERIKKDIKSFIAKSILKKDVSEEGIGYGLLGQLYAGMNDLKKSDVYVNKALKLAPKVKNREFYKIIILLNCAAAMTDSIHTERMKSFIERAVRLLDKPSVASLPDKKLCAIYASAGFVYHYLCDFTNSLMFFRKAIKFKEYEHFHTLYNNIGSCYIALDKPEKAKRYLDIALKYARTGNEPNLHHIYENYALYYKSRKQYSKARDFLKKSILLTTAENLSKKIHLAEIELETNNPEKAADIFYKAVEEAKRAGHSRDLFEAYSGLTEVCMKTNNRRNAILYYNKAKELAEKLGFIDVINRISSLKKQILSLKPRKRRTDTGSGTALEPIGYYQALLEMTHDFNSSPELNLLLQAILRKLADIFHIRKGFIYIYGQAKESRPRYIAVYGLDYENKHDMEYAEKTAEHALNSNRIAINYDWVRRIEMISIPLLNNSSLLGIIYVENASERFMEPEIDLLQGISDVAVLAITNALYYEKISASFSQTRELLQKQESELAKTKTILQENSIQMQEHYNIDGKNIVIGSNERITKIIQLIKRTATTMTPVLIEGETGTGKDVIARLFHFYSNRKEMPLVSINCAALPVNLVESELFGHKKGSFTGAVTDKQGLFVTANKGSLFLDEIGTMPLETQAKLLRAIEHKEIRPIGDNHNLSVDIRLICASNLPLTRLVEQNKFREDLFYRINALHVSVPALRERKEDIPLFIAHFVKKTALETGIQEKKISGDAMRYMLNYGWPGNIRELENKIMCAYMFEGDTILPQHLTSADTDISTYNLPTNGVKEKNERQGMIKAVDDFKISLVKRALAGNNNNRTLTAKALGITRQYLLYLMNKYNIE